MDLATILSIGSFAVSTGKAAYEVIMGKRIQRLLAWQQTGKSATVHFAGLSGNTAAVTVP